MNRTELIEEIEDHHGTMHESITDEINDSTDEQLMFFLWRLKNNWQEYDGHDRFIHLPTCGVLSAEKLKAKYLIETL